MEQDLMDRDRAQGAAWAPAEESNPHSPKQADVEPAQAGPDAARGAETAPVGAAAAAAAAETTNREWLNTLREFE